MASVLVIDDDANVRSALIHVLKRAGFAVEAADGGESGVRAYRRLHPDLVITDIFMPDKEGIATMLEIRREDPAARVLAISGGGNLLGRDMLLAASRLGAVATLGKPFAAAELLAKVQTCLAAPADRVNDP